MKVTYYEGERIYLRPLELADEPRFRVWVNDPANWSTLGKAFPTNERREREFLEKLYETNDQCLLGVVVREADRLIGSVSLRDMHPVNRCGTFGLLVGDLEQQGKGYGSEATRLMVRMGFEEFNLNRIQLSVMAHHERAVRLYERAGFVLEGRSREAYFRQGRYVDALRYAILRSDWEKQAAVRSSTG